MPQRRPDFALRKLIGELAALAPGEIDAVLADLDPRDRQRVVNLLDDFSGVNNPRAESDTRGAPPVLSGLSPCLRSRFERGPEDTVTAAAWSAFTKAVEAVPFEPASTGEVGGGRSAWFRRFLRSVTQVRTRA